MIKSNTSQIGFEDTTISCPTGVEAVLAVLVAKITPRLSVQLIKDLDYDASCMRI